MFTSISSFTIFFLIGILATALCLIFEDKLIVFEQKAIKKMCHKGKSKGGDINAD